MIKIQTNLKIKRNPITYDNILSTVEKIINDVRDNKDSAVLKYTKKFDKVNLKKTSIEVTREEIEEAYTRLTQKQIEAIKQAAKNIEVISRKQPPKQWQIQTEYGTIGEKIIPLERVGCYIPGGNYPLSSTALMTIIPAKVGGVNKVVVVTPPNKECKADSSILVAVDIAGADRIFKVGGPQAIAALAYGTKTISKVDKIVGPGNIYVTTAKKLVYGDVDIDFLAGPTEVLIIADDTTKSEWVAADLVAQAEHDVNAYPILVTPSKELANRVVKEIETQLENLSTRDIAEKSLENNGKIVLTKTLEECFDIANNFAPEHLKIQVKDAEKYLDRVKNAGTIFIGEYSVEAFGDYTSGTNHVLPTGGLARSRGGLSVRDFLKFVIYQNITKKGMKELQESTITLARLEGLEAHEKSVEIRGD